MSRPFLPLLKIYFHDHLWMIISAWEANRPQSLLDCRPASTEVLVYSFALADRSSGWHKNVSLTAMVRYTSSSLQFNAASSLFDHNIKLAIMLLVLPNIKSFVKGLPTKNRFQGTAENSALCSCVDHRGASLNAPGNPVPLQFDFSVTNHGDCSLVDHRIYQTVTPWMQ